MRYKSNTSWYSYPILVRSALYGNGKFFDKFVG